jgi:Glycosyl transferase family 2
VKIHLYSKIWNEEEMLPFFFRHYDPIIDRYIIYDDGSTDNTLKLLAEHDRVEVRRFARMHPTSLVLSAQELNNNMWKESRGQADWVILASPDEHLYHPVGLRRYLHVARCRGITAVPALAFQMVADKFPSSEEYLAKTRRSGAPLDDYNKLSVFDPVAVRETHFGVGRHVATPEGRIRFPKRDQLLLFHYKFVGIDYVLRRYALLNARLGPTDKQNRWGHQYEFERDVLEAEFAELRRSSVDVTSAQARKLIRKKWWRPTRVPPRHRDTQAVARD